MRERCCGSSASRAWGNGRSGNCRAVCVSGSALRALIANPDVLLMDEPLGALDALTREQMQELILDVWARTGKSVFFITHGIDEAVFLASKLLVMSPRPGRLIASLDLDFSRQFAAGATSGDVKSRPEFVATRERVKELIFSSRQLAEVAL
jgi:taurine transport system ATP-binding protein